MPSDERKERRRREIAERKAAAKARLAKAAEPPTVPVALPWRRRPSGAKLARQERAEGAAWSMVMSGDAGDIAGGLAAAATMVHAVGPFLKGVR